MLHHPCILGDLQTKGTKSKHKKKNFPPVSLILPVVLQTAPRQQHLGGGPRQPAQRAGSRGRGGA